MKRLISICLAIFLCVGMLSACGGRKKDADPQENLPTVPELPTSKEKDTIDYDALSRLPFDGLAETPASEFAYTSSSAGVTVTAYNGSSDRVRIPDVINGSPVVAIGDRAFSSSAELKILVIPDSVTSFGEKVLAGCSELYALRTPLPEKDGTYFLGYLFGAISYEVNNVQDLRTLDFLEIGGALTSLPSYALYDCNDLVTVRLPESITVIEEYALYRCESLKWINLDGIQVIGRNAMDHCYEIERITLSSNLTEIGLAAFGNCYSARNLTLPFVGGSRTENRYLGYIFGASDPSFSKGFYPPALRSVTLLDGADRIDDYAFYEAEWLCEVVVPATVRSIGTRAFFGCYRLHRITVPTGVTEIGDFAFGECLNLTAMTLPEGLTHLGVGVFSTCLSLTEINLPSTLTSLPGSTFLNCRSLTTVRLGGVSKVGKRAFWGCDALTALESDGKVRFEKGNSNAKKLLK